MSIPLSGARPTLSGADAGPTTAALGGVVFAGLGVWLFVRVGLRDRRMAARISRVVGYQERGREFRKRAVMEGKSGNAASAKADADAWVDEAFKWFRRELPTYAEVFVRPTNAVMGFRDDLTDSANELVNNFVQHRD